MANRNDRGRAALAAVGRYLYERDPSDDSRADFGDIGLMRPHEWAAAILGERGVFLPEGTQENAERLLECQLTDAEASAEVERLEAEIKRLRDALGRLPAVMRAEALRLAADWNLDRKQRNSALGFVGGLAPRIVAATLAPKVSDEATSLSAQT